MKRLEQRVAVVTGAGSGIGRAVSLLLAEKGCRLALADVNESGLAETERLVRAKNATVSTHQVDVSDRSRMQGFVDEVVQRHGGVNIVINNAGVSCNAKFNEQSLEDFEWVMNINFWGVVYGCKLFMPHLLAAEEAHIVNISSLFGLIGVPQQTSYCASKFAVRGFSESLRAELINTRVGMTTVHPGGIATNIVTSSRVIGDEKLRAGHDRAVKAFRKFLPPSAAAALIVRGIKENRQRVLITRETYFMDFAKRLAPVASNVLVDWGFKAVQ